MYPITDAFPISNPWEPVPFHLGHGTPKKPTPQSGDPVAAIDVHADVKTLLVATSCALKLQVPFGCGKSVNCPNVNRITDPKHGLTGLLCPLISGPIKLC
jgi:hypothetical protein